MSISNNAGTSIFRARGVNSFPCICVIFGDFPDCLVSLGELKATCVRWRSFWGSRMKNTLLPSSPSRRMEGAAVRSYFANCDNTIPRVVQGLARSDAVNLQLVEILPRGTIMNGTPLGDYTSVKCLHAPIKY